MTEARQNGCILCDSIIRNYAKGKIRKEYTDCSAFQEFGNGDLNGT